ncbi:hypothetical protein GF108_21010 [Phyllobacterium sp. SYP-B3895]|uniref:hypothetical protein n=1 Tax=Phyllobacterium sp. SYP-B3895 TaxID=2663240 RepID=UPI0012999848|nr:hypothetical protein [Phyllobacterium sp. SYP-B3895]MRG58049.1 hypothetical protein [Phyllobacterium sp. SYP-B3895]
MPIQGPPSCEEYADRTIDCQKALEPRFREMLEQKAQLLDILEEATSVGWSREESLLALNELLAAQTKEDDALEGEEEDSPKKNSH